MKKNKRYYLLAITQDTHFYHWYCRLLQAQWSKRIESFTYKFTAGSWLYVEVTMPKTLGNVLT
jgi:hypothetical protein